MAKEVYFCNMLEEILRSASGLSGVQHKLQTAWLRASDWQHAILSAPGRFDLEAWRRAQQVLDQISACQTLLTTDPVLELLVQGDIVREQRAR